MLRIERDFSLDQVERALQAVVQGETALQLPHSIKTNAAGTEVALLQLIISWARRAPEHSTLRLHSKADDVRGQESFARTPFGLTALTMARVVQSQSGDELDRYGLLLMARDYVVAMAEKPLAVLREYDKSTFPFLCIDNAREYRRPKRFYIPGTDRVRERPDFASLIKSCASLLPVHRKLRHPEIFEAAASLLYEAFQNTHDHAQTDYRGNILRRSVRGLLLNFQYVRLDALAQAGGASAPLQSYYRNWRPDIASAQHAQFLEIAIFDSGPGLARRWLKAEPALAGRLPEGNAIEDEYRAVIQCLHKGATTKAGSTSGYGLFRIMHVVKRMGGLVRIRTGNLSLVKTFDGRDAPLTSEDLQLEDLERGGYDIARRAWAEGTSLSVLLPTNRAVGH